LNLPSTAAFQAQSPHEQLRTLFDIAVKKSLPENCLPEFLESIDASNGLCVIGAGKAAAEMAAIVNKHFAGQCNGAVVTRYGYSSEQDTGDIEVLLAAHPYPDENSEIAAKSFARARRAKPCQSPYFVYNFWWRLKLTEPASGWHNTTRKARH
jgi:hydroxypyruvate reductase